MLYSAGSSIQCSVTTQRGRMGLGLGGRFGKEEIYVYLWLIHRAIWQKPVQYCKSIILQLNIIFFFNVSCLQNQSLRDCTGFWVQEGWARLTQETNGSPNCSSSPLFSSLHFWQQNWGFVWGKEARRVKVGENLTNHPGLGRRQRITKLPWVFLPTWSWFWSESYVSFSASAWTFPSISRYHDF